LPSSAENFFADEAIARAGILAFTLNGADVPVTLTALALSQQAARAWFYSDQLSTAAASPIGRSEACVVADGKLYVFGGYINTTSTQPADQTCMTRSTILGRG